MVFIQNSTLTTYPACTDMPLSHRGRREELQSTSFMPRLQRIRIVWFILGILAGVILAQFIHIATTDEVAAFVEEKASALASITGDTPAPADVPAPPVSTTAVITDIPDEPAYPTIKEVTISSGDTLVNILKAQNVALQDAHNSVDALRKVYNPRYIKAGQTVSIALDAPQENTENPVLSKLMLPISTIASVEINRNAEGVFEATKKEKKIHTKLVRGAGPISHSLYQTGRNQGMSHAQLAELIKALSYDVDFQRDIHSGHTLEVLFEQAQLGDGTSIDRGGHLRYATLTMGKKKLTIYRYTDKDGITDYYNANGESVRKALLRTPINGARLSSGFGMRHHPVLGYNKMHKGVDFAAPTGTPIYAAGDGKVVMAGRHGGYGNYVKLQHTSKYSSAYAHLHRFGKNIRKGKHVKQGDIIGYVGTTGRSTGPHLHYEVLAHNRQVNPSQIKFKTGRVLSGRELAAFKQLKQTTHASLQTTPRARTELAQAH